MTCDISGSGCKICPAMWIALILFLVMTIQSVLFRPPAPANATKIDATPSTSHSDEPTDVQP